MIPSVTAEFKTSFCVELQTRKQGHLTQFNLPLRVNCEVLFVVEGNSAAKIHYRMLRVYGEKMMEFFLRIVPKI